MYWFGSVRSVIELVRRNQFLQFMLVIIFAALLCKLAKLGNEKLGRIVLFCFLVCIVVWSLSTEQLSILPDITKVMMFL
jgi:hypothetical protein